ncbi:ribonuclease H-like domain-containing protein [Tanacetum coccineum]
MLRPTNANIVRCMWLFRHKYLADGTLSHYKACLVANGSMQLEVHQLDVKNALLHGDLSETVYMHQPSGFRDSTHPDYYAAEILERVHMANCNSSRTPVDTESKLGDDGDQVSDPTLNRSLADHGFQLFSSSTTSLTAYSDADWASCLATWRLTFDAEYRGVANAVTKTCSLQNLLRDFHTPLSFAMLVYCDNVSAVYLSSNPVQHQRTKHTEIDIYFVRDLIAAGQV